jgi:hypothetical protein
MFKYAVATVAVLFLVVLLFVLPVIVRQITDGILQVLP